MRAMIDTPALCAVTASSTARGTSPSAALTPSHASRSPRDALAAVPIPPAVSRKSPSTLSPPRMNTERSSKASPRATTARPAARKGAITGAHARIRGSAAAAPATPRAVRATRNRSLLRVTRARNPVTRAIRSVSQVTAGASETMMEDRTPSKA